MPKTNKSKLLAHIPQISPIQKYRLKYHTDFTSNILTNNYLNLYLSITSIFFAFGCHFVKFLFVPSSKGDTATKF